MAGRKVHQASKKAASNKQNEKETTSVGKEIQILDSFSGRRLFH